MSKRVTPDIWNRAKWSVVDTLSATSSSDKTAALDPGEYMLFSLGGAFHVEAAAVAGADASTSDVPVGQYSWMPWDIEETGQALSVVKASGEDDHTVFVCKRWA